MVERQWSGFRWLWAEHSRRIIKVNRAKDGRMATFHHLVYQSGVTGFGNGEYRLETGILKMDKMCSLLHRKKESDLESCHAMTLSAEETKTLSEELATLSKQQFMARQSAIFIRMTRPEAADYDARRNRIAEIYGILGTFKASSLSPWVITPTAIYQA